VRIAVIGHVEHVTLGRVDAAPGPGEIAHLREPRMIPGGGGGIAFAQLTRSPAELHLFTTLGNDDAAEEVAAALARTGAKIHAARRDQRHTRDVVMITPDGERAIVVVGEPLHPVHDDELPWDVLAHCDAVYFTAQDPALLQRARAAPLLAVTARRHQALLASHVRADLVIGSRFDPRESFPLESYPLPPAALVLTEGAQGGSIVTTGERFPAAPSPPAGGGAYGAGDSFAGALTFYAAIGLPLVEACRRAAVHGAAVLRGLDPLEFQLPLTP
jgi:ribokinase